ncbi:hypothetical protein FHW71_003339 [Enterobacter sp. Sphag1F]|nr:hypothetical protein [Enterobacter sp. Sphag1F]NYI15924.1 hypothetical protein [Enterobacter sp. Sphag71]
MPKLVLVVNIPVKGTLLSGLHTKSEMEYVFVSSTNPLMVK